MQAQQALQTVKGRKCVVVDGFTMIYHMTSPNAQIEYWRCSHYKTCSARAKRKVGSEAVVMNAGSTHNHLVDPISPVKRARISVLKQSAAANYATPSQSLAADAQSGLSEEELVRFPSQRSLQRAVATMRRVDMGPEPDLPPDQLVLPDLLRVTERGERYLLFDSRINEPDKPAILAYCSDTGAKLLRDNSSWCADGTFFSAPLHFNNVFIVCGMVGHSALPAIHILMPNREQDTYERALQGCFSAEALRDVRPTSVLCDFELGLSNAVRKQFPRAAIRYCLFHLAKAVWMQLQKKGLIPIYGDAEVRNLLRCFVALATIPAAEVKDGFKKVCDALRALIPSKIPIRYRENLNRFFSYFANTYTGRMNGRVVVHPRYNIGEWNCHERILTGEPRTNNANEGYNASFNSLFPKSNIPLSQFVVRLKKDEERTRDLIVRNGVRRAEPIRGRPQALTVRQQNLRALVESYAAMEHEKRDRLDFLLKVQYLLSETAFARMVKTGDALNDDGQQACCSQASAGSSQTSDVEAPASSQGSAGDTQSDLFPSTSSLASAPSQAAPYRGHFSAFDFDV